MKHIPLRLHWFSPLLILLLMTQVTIAQKSLATLGVPVVENFTGFTGTGFVPAPAAGQLDSDEFSTAGFSGANVAFGGSCTTDDCARGSDPDGVTTGGVYAFAHTGEDVGLGVQPAGSDFTPGSFTVRYTNNTGVAVAAFAVAYTIWDYNDQGRANSFNFSHSFDCSTFSSVAALNFTSTEIAAGSPAWASTPRSGSFALGGSVANGSNFCIRFTGDDVSGSGSRDQFAVDALSMSAQIALPVELISFEAVSESDAVLLSWSTASETNNAGFEVQHRISGQTQWNRLDFVDGDGSTLETQAYQYRANNLPAGTHAFRLKQVDFDGAFEYSQTVEVTLDVPGTHVLSGAYPNPFNPSATFSITVPVEQQIQVTLHDVSGRLVQTLYQGTVPAHQQHGISIDGSGLSSGVYLYRATGKNFTQSRTVTLQK
jgi:hypothetical protein